MLHWSLSRIHGLRHASDDALAFLALVGPEASPPRLVDHVASCGRCSLRLDAVEQTLADERRHVMAADDLLFSPARMDRQRAGILRRIGGSRAAARILPFPAHGPLSVAPRRRMVRRYVAAAAIGGLLIGAAAGRLLDPHRQDGFRSTRAMDTRGVVGPGGVQTVRASALAEEAFLGEFEAAIGAPRIEPLLALDALTPRPADDGIVH